MRRPADRARWLLPIAPANTALADHAVAVSAGRILAMGPPRNCAHASRSASAWCASGMRCCRAW